MLGVFLPLFVDVAVPILFAVAVVAAGYGVALLKHKLKIEKHKTLQELAQETVLEVEEVARRYRKANNGDKMPSDQKRVIAEEKLREKSGVLGIKIPRGVGAIASVISFAVNKLR